MFFGKHKKLARMIDAFSETWALAQATEARLSGSNPPRIQGPYFAIMYGAVDSLGQSIGADTATVKKALLLHLHQYDNGEEIFQRIADTIHDPMMRSWILQAGEAVYAIRAGNADPAQALLPLAERYRREVG